VATAERQPLAFCQDSGRQRQDGDGQDGQRRFDKKRVGEKPEPTFNAEITV